MNVFQGKNVDGGKTVRFQTMALRSLDRVNPIGKTGDLSAPRKMCPNGMQKDEIRIHLKGSKFITGASR